MTSAKKNTKTASAIAYTSKIWRGPSHPVLSLVGFVRVSGVVPPAISRHLSAARKTKGDDAEAEVEMAARMEVKSTVVLEFDFFCIVMKE